MTGIFRKHCSLVFPAIILPSKYNLMKQSHRSIKADYVQTIDFGESLTLNGPNNTRQMG
ncbi:uncharacterized protein METZ01_LOCUS314871 [marine metagenome]|uniref:Uncharacterized protein n=1 Tax=marine metagenome TaxID=408172 RepID=A0A382NNW7_9ZZZZ